MLDIDFFGREDLRKSVIAVLDLSHGLKKKKEIDKLQPSFNLMMCKKSNQVFYKQKASDALILHDITHDKRLAKIKCQTSKKAG